MHNFYISSTLSNFLNFLRWLSALFVFIGHTRSILFYDLNNATTHLNLFWKIFYFLTGFGYIAVIVFFVISGFLVSGSMIKRYHNEKLSFKNYLFIDRGIRIYIVLFPVMILTFIADKLRTLYLNESGIYSLYLLHFPLLVLSVAMLNKYFAIDIQNNPSIDRLAIFLLIIFSIYIFSYIFASFTEKKTKIIQQGFIK